MIVYVDVLFFYNFLVNTLLLYISGYILKLKIRWFKIIGGGAFGALYGVFTVICNIHPVLNSLFKLLCAFVMTVISYRESVKGYLKLLSTLLVVSFCMCGVYMAFSSFMSLDGDGEMVFLNLGYPYIFLAIVVFVVLLSFFTEGAYVRIKKSDLYKKVEIVNRGKKVKVTGFVDTGNSLITPEGFPVAFINQKYITKLITIEELEKIKRGDKSDVLYPVSFTTVIGEKTKTGFMPDDVLICGKSVKLIIIPVDEDFEKNFDILLGGSVCLN